MRWPEEHSVPNHCVLCRHGRLRPTLLHVASRVLGGPHELIRERLVLLAQRFERPACHLMTTYDALEFSMDAKHDLLAPLSIHPLAIRLTRDQPEQSRGLRRHRVKRLIAVTGKYDIQL
jgi:hypothetical protein